MELIKLLETQLQKKAVGTLTLGKRSSFRELFFEEDQLYVAGEIYSGKIHIDEVLAEQVIGKRLPIDKLETIILNTDLDHHLLPQVLHDQGIIDDTEVTRIAAGHILEESVDLLYRNSGSFHFQEGRVPEYLMKCEDITVRTPVAIADILAELRRRTELMEGYRLLVPSDEEIFVLTEKGLAVKGTSRSNFLLKRLLDLIDGFRNLRLLVQDSRFYEFHVLGTISKCLEDGHIKKTIHPELKGLATHTFSVADATRYLPYYKNAVKYGVDELAARERLAVVYERLSKVEDAVIQYNFIGDALYRMKKPGKAVKAYQRALSLKPGEILITEKISKIYREAAEEEIANGNMDQAAQLLESAIRLQPADREVFRRILKLHVSQHKLKELSDLCDWIIAYARKTRTPEIGIQTCMEIMREVPRNSAFRKKLINLYLDFDMKAEATSVMEDLARHYFEKGHVEKAQDLIEKIRRTGVPGAASRDIVKQIEGMRPNGRAPARRDRTARILVIAVLGFCVYQAFTFRAWTDLRNQCAFAEALGETEKKPRSLLPDPDEARCAQLAKDLRKFMNVHLISLFRTNASKLSGEVEERLAKQRATREDRIRVAIEGAKRHLQEGRRKEVEGALGILLELEPGDRFRTEAEAMLKKASRFTASAEDLLEKAQSLELAEDWKGAHRVYCQIMETFPQSMILKSMRVPLSVTSFPSGAQVRAVRADAESTVLGRTPLILSLVPGQGLEIEVASPGYQAVRSVVQDIEVHDRSFILLREHAWTLSLDGAVEVPAAIEGPWMVVGTSQGVLACVDITKGRTAWVRKGSAIKSLVAPPVLTDHGMYTVWNNGRVVRFG
jgi:tetratricopeptide (TPR) repeat protein